MNDRKDELVESFKRGNLPETIYASSSRLDGKDQGELVQELVALHNEGLIDLIAAFADLKNASASDVDFFLARNVFQKALLNLNASVTSVMHCVLQLYREARQDTTAGWIFDGFIDFCTKDSSRPRAALDEIEANPDAFIDLLVATLIAGSRIDHPQYLAEAIRLCEHKNLELRRRAVHSVGKFSSPQALFTQDTAFAALERSAERESDDQILAGVVRSTFALFRQDRSRQDRAVGLIVNALANAGELTLHAASEIFAFYGSELSPSIIDVLLPHLKKIRSANTGTLRNIDHGISYQLQKGEPEQAISLLESSLIADSGKLALKSFSSTAHLICSNRMILSKVITRWFLRGDPVLCDWVQTVTAANPMRNVPIEIDSAELKTKDFVQVIFVAHKAIGYLFYQPVSAASIVVSLIRHATDDETLSALGLLLSDPLLLNFTRSVYAYLIQQSVRESGKVKETIERAVKGIDKYLETLSSVGTLPALHPSSAQREARHRRFLRTMTEAYEAAEAQSPLLSVVSKSVLLYGRKSVDYIYDGSGQSHRMQMDLKSHGTEIEYPRMALIDPLGLDYMLRVFRIEQLEI